MKVASYIPIIFSAVLASTCINVEGAGALRGAVPSAPALEEEGGALESPAEEINDGQRSLYIDCPEADKDLFYPIQPQICTYRWGSGKYGTFECKYANRDAARSAGFSVRRDYREDRSRTLAEEDKAEDVALESPSTHEGSKPTAAAEETDNGQRSLGLACPDADKDLFYPIQPHICTFRWGSGKYGTMDCEYANRDAARSAGFSVSRQCREKPVDNGPSRRCPKADKDLFYPIQPHVCRHKYGNGQTRRCEYANRDAARSAGFSVSRDCRLKN